MAEVRVGDLQLRNGQLHLRGLGEEWQRLVSNLAEIQSRLGPASVENVYVMAPRAGTLFVGGDPTGDDPPFTVQDTVYFELKTRVLSSAGSPSLHRVPAPMNTGRGSADTRPRLVEDLHELLREEPIDHAHGAGATPDSD